MFDDSVPALEEPTASGNPVRDAGLRHPELEAFRQADGHADDKFAEALRNNQRGDKYTVLTVASATVLFFGALSGRMRPASAPNGLVRSRLYRLLAAASLLFF
jgi:hypothetical protein